MSNPVENEKLGCYFNEGNTHIHTETNVKLHSKTDIKLMCQKIGIYIYIYTNI